MTPAIRSLEAFDRYEERALREWLRQFSRLLTELI
jgi:hypothetical protein